MKLTLTINGKKHELTAEEARRIYRELQKVFGDGGLPLLRPDPKPIEQHPPGWYNRFICSSRS